MRLKKDRKAHAAFLLRIGQKVRIQEGIRGRKKKAYSVTLHLTMVPQRGTIMRFAHACMRKAHDQGVRPFLVTFVVLFFSLSLHKGEVVFVCAFWHSIGRRRRLLQLFS